MRASEPPGSLLPLHPAYSLVTLPYLASRHPPRLRAFVSATSALRCLAHAAPALARQVEDVLRGSSALLAMITLAGKRSCLRQHARDGGDAICLLQGLQVRPSDHTPLAPETRAVIGAHRICRRAGGPLSGLAAAAMQVSE